MAYQADGAVVVVGRVLMMMGRGHDGGRQKKRYEEDDKTSVEVYVAPFTHERRINSVDKFVKKMFPPWPRGRWFSHRLCFLYLADFRGKIFFLEIEGDVHKSYQDGHFNQRADDSREGGA